MRHNRAAVGGYSPQSSTGTRSGGTCAFMPHLRDETALTLAQPDRAIPRMDDQRLAAAVHLAVNLRVTEGAFHRYGDAQADVAVACAGVNVRLEARREHQVHATVAGPDRPARHQLRTRPYAGVHTAISRLHVDAIESPRTPDMPITRISLHLAI